MISFFVSSSFGVFSSLGLGRNFLELADPCYDRKENIRRSIAKAPQRVFQSSAAMNY